MGLTKHTDPYFRGRALNYKPSIFVSGVLDNIPVSWKARQTKEISIVTILKLELDFRHGILNL